MKSLATPPASSSSSFSACSPLPDIASSSPAEPSAGPWSLGDSRPLSSTHAPQAAAPPRHRRAIAIGIASITQPRDNVRLTLRRDERSGRRRTGPGPRTRAVPGVRCLCSGAPCTYVPVLATLVTDLV